MVRLALCFAITVCFAAPATTVGAQINAALASDTGDYLRPGDAIQLRFFADSGMSGQFRVDERGRVVLPMLGERDAAHQSPDRLRRDIRDAYAQYLKFPPDVLVLRRITVLGAVMKPGLYLADPTMSVADVLALAGGASPDGRTDEIQIVRNGERLATTVSSQMSVRATPVQSGDALYVPQRGWAAHNAPMLLAGLSSLAVITSVLLRR